MDEERNADRDFTSLESLEGELVALEAELKRVDAESDEPASIEDHETP